MESNCLPAKIQEYEDTYFLETFKCGQEFVLVRFHSYRALKNSTQIGVYRDVQNRCNDVANLICAT